MAASTYTEVISPATSVTWGPGDVSTRPTTSIGSDERQVVIGFNQFCYASQNLLAALGGAEVPMTTTTLAIGSTDTNISMTAQTISINAVAVVLAADTDEALGSLGTIPAATWGLIAVERIAAGTISYVSAADNYTTGYATEALAIAAVPAISANKVRIGYFTVEAQSGNAWIAGTDALAGGSTGNQANATNYYVAVGAADAEMWSPVYQVASEAGSPITTAVG